METVGENLANWRASLVSSIPVAGLVSRNEIAYKWKALFRCWVLREAAFWRVTDLLTQSYELYQLEHGLGARILLRSGFETLASLSYLNHKLQAVIDGKLDFHEFDRLTIRMVAGSKDGFSQHIAVNVITTLDKCDKRYPGVRGIYDSLSESAHPNFEGMVWGYSKVDYDEYETNFSNRWMELHRKQHLNNLEICMMIFQHEYDELWTDLIEKLESWIVVNDTKLEATKDIPLPN